MSCKGCASNSNNSESNSLTLPRGPIGLSGKDAVFKDFPRNAAMLYDGTLIEFLTDFPSGLGVGKWAGWAWMNGSNNTRDARGKFIVTYSDSIAEYNDIGLTGGSNTKSLILANIPSHGHTISDPGHTHAVNDVGHSHGLVMNSHTHSLIDPGHTHTGSTNVTGAHTHSISTFFLSFTSPGGAADSAWSFDSGEAPTTPVTNSSGDHSHTLSINSANSGITLGATTATGTIGNNVTSVTNGSNTTGITINTTGTGTSFDIRPSYYVLVLIKKTV